MLNAQVFGRPSVSSRLWSFLLASLAVLLAVACSGDGDPAKAPAGPSAAAPAAEPTAKDPLLGPQIDVSGVMKRTRLRFRPDGAAWVGGLSSYTARVGADGVRLSPRVSAKDEHPVRTGAPLALGAPAVARGGGGGRGPAAIVDEEKGLAIDRGLAVERLENTEQGLEQSFRFEARPAGGGDVTVRVPVSGQRYDGATANGLHFVDDATRLGVRYGVPTWVGADGERTPVGLAYDAGAIVLTVPAALVDGSAYPAVLDPTIGPEIGTDTPIYASSSDAQVSGVSYGGGQHLVVWGDTGNEETGGALWASRVSAAGSVLDPYGIFLAFPSQGAQVAFDGTNWLVVWYEIAYEVAGDPSFGTSTTVYGTLVSAAGVPATPGGAPIVANGTDQLWGLTVSYGGGTYLVSYSDTTYAVHGQLVSTSGAPSGSPFSIFTSTTIMPNGDPVDVASAFNGTSFLVAYAQRPEAIIAPSIVAREVTPFGITASGDIVVVEQTAYSDNLAVASDGTDWMIAWVEDYPSVKSIQVARVTAAGSAPDAATGGVTAISAAGPVGGMAIAWDGTDYGVFCDQTVSGADDIWAARVSPALEVVSTGSSMIGEAGSHSLPAVSFDTVNGLYFVAFDDNRLATTANPDAEDVRFDRFDTSFVEQESPSVLLTKGANDEEAPSAAWNGTDWLVAWLDFRGADPAIWATRVDVNGNVLDTSGIPIESQAGGGTRVASDGTNWLVVWSSIGIDGNIYAARVDPNGTVLDTTPVQVATGIASIGHVAYGESTYAIVYASTSTTVSLQLLSSAAVPLPGTIAIGDGISPSVAFNGASFLVAYLNIDSGPVIQAKRVTPTGTVLDTTALTVSSMGALGDPAATALGGQWLVGWEEQGQLRAARISAAGTVLDVGGFVVVSAACCQILADANNDGTNYWLLWYDSRKNGYDARAWGDLWGGRVSPAGAPIDGTGFPVVLRGAAPDLGAPALSAGPAGNLLVTYTRLAVSPSEDATRVYSRILSASGSSSGTGGGATSTSSSSGTGGGATSTSSSSGSGGGATSTSSSSGTGGGATTATGTGGEGTTSGGGTTGSTSGCGCRTAGDDDATNPAALMALSGIVIAAARRRRADRRACC